MIRRFYIFLLFFLNGFAAAEKATAQGTSLSDNFNYYQTRIDRLLTEGEIDSANYHLEKSLRSGSKYKSAEEEYFFRARKMEINYYYDLGKLGLVDAKKNLDWVLEHGNNVMKMDAYNFTGLFYLILGNWQESIESYKLGLTYLNNAITLSYETSTSYHLQNNLAEAFLKIGQLDSAVKYSRLAAKGASQKNDHRMIALSLYQMAVAFSEIDRVSESDSLLSIAKFIAKEHEFLDVELICLGYLALSHSLSFSQQKTLINEGFQLLKTNAINSFYTKDFYKQTLIFYERTDNYEGQNNVLRNIAAIEDRKKAKELNYLVSQYDEVISENEKRIALEKSNLQKSKDLQSLIIVTALTSILVLIAILLIFFLRIKRKDAVLDIRSAISRDLHDDLGSSLSSLNIYSNILNNTTTLPVEKQKDVTQKITTITKDLMNNLHDIIWSLDKNKNQTSLEDLLKSYAMNMLTNKGIEVKINIAHAVEAALTSPKARKNILMVLKEIMNNCSKYSVAQHFYLDIFMKKNIVHIVAKDDGKGFEAEAISMGNGLKNMQRRIAELNGVIHIESTTNDGSKIEMHLPATNIRMKEYFLKRIFTKNSRALPNIG